MIYFVWWKINNSTGQRQNKRKKIQKQQIRCPSSNTSLNNQHGDDCGKPRIEQWILTSIIIHTQHFLLLHWPCDETTQSNIQLSLTKLNNKLVQQAIYNKILIINVIIVVNVHPNNWLCKQCDHKKKN